MNVEELVEMCNEFPGKTVKECYAVGANHGVCTRHVDVLRHILGITLPKAPPLNDDFVQQIEDMWNSDPNITAYDIGQKLSYSYQSIYKILKRKGYDTNRKRENWSVFTARRLLYAKDVMHLPWTKVPGYVGNNLSTSACQQMYYQITRPDLYPTRGKKIRIELGLQEPDPKK